MAKGNQAVRTLESALEDALPSGFEVVGTRSFEDEDGCPVLAAVLARGDDGAVVTLTRRWLHGAASLFEIPLSQDRRHVERDDGADVVLDDFEGDGTRRTVVVVTDDGVMTTAVATGRGAPDLSGWPTTRPPDPEAADVEPEPAPLDLDELEALAGA